MNAVGTSLGTSPQRYLNSAGVMPDDVYEKNKKYTEDIAHFVGTLFIGGASSLAEGGSTVASAFNEAAVLASDTTATAAYNAAIGQGLTEVAAQTAYDTAFLAAMENAGQSAIKKMALEAVTTYAKKWVIKEMLGAAFPDSAESGKLGINFEGMSGGEGLGQSIKNFPGSIDGEFAFSALNGLDYVPRDNFKINAHEGEAVITKEENKARLNGTIAYGAQDTNLPPVQVNLILDGKVLSKTIYKQTKAGVKVVHDRGTTNI